MNGPRRKPSNMGEVCRLCLAEDEITSPIFGEEDSSSESQIPLSFRIMACVSVEVSESDGLPKVICDKCLYHVNSWHEFKQICDVSQATLKEWQNNAKDNTLLVDKDVIIKQEPEDPEPEEDVMEIIDDPVNCQFMVEDIKQEVDMYGEEAQDCLSVEAVEEECLDPLGMPVACTSNSIAKDIDDPDVEVVPQTAGDVCHLRITDIKTECGDVIPVGDVTVEPTEGRLLRSVLQGKANIPMYVKKVPPEPQLAYPTVKPFNCRLCDKSFSYAYLLKRHQKTHKGDRNVCAFCQKGFSTHASLVQHVRFFNGVTSSPYTCDHCQQEFACRTQYLSHADGSDASGCNIVLSSKDHPQEVEELLDGSVQCEVCGEKFPSQMLLRLHSRKEHLQFSCHKCDKSYTNGVALSNHLRSHTLGGVRHHCESCTRTFPTYELLKKHERTHMKENAAMTIIPTEIVSKSSDYDSQEEASVPLSEITGFLDRPIKVEPPDSPEVIDEPQPSPTPSGNATSQQSHVCHLCNEHFPTIASLRFHLKGVHLHYQCHRCPKVYSSGVALSNHLRSHSLGTFKKHKCLACLKSFSSLELLTKHKKIHTAPGGLQSLTVRTRRLNNSVPSVDIEHQLELPNFEENEIEDVNEPLVKRTCTVCNLVAASPSALGRHMACHTKEKMYTCSVCHVSMSYASSLQKHYRLIHNKHVELRAIQKNSVVDDNEIIPVPETQEVPQHDSGKIETTRSGRRIIFKKTFKMASQLQQAQLPLPFECKVCHRTFAYRSFLLRHSKVHNKVTKLPKLPKFTSGVNCPICFKSFPDAKTLNNHKGVHTRFKHFSCNICGKSFNGLNAWQKHERMHQKGFIYSCKLCGKKFISKAELHEHKKMHIKLKIYTCAVCKNSYHSSSALGKHKRRHGHWYASPENSEVSDIDIINGYDLTVTKAPVVKTTVFKSPVVKTTLPRSLVNPTITKAHLSRNMTHFPSGKRRPCCNICHKTFSHLSALRRHKRLHALKPAIPATPEQKLNPNVVETEENACLTCNRTFPDHVSLVRHKGWHTRRGNVISPEPADSSTPPGKLPINPLFVKVEPASNHPYQCPLCHKTTFTTGAALASHIRSHANHARNRAKSQANPAKSQANHATQSEASSKAAERRTENWKANANAEKGEVLTSPRRLACKICKKPFESKKALITHIGWHSRDSHMGKPFHSYKNKLTPKISSIDNFSCNVCHKIFSSAVILSQHKKLHTRKLLSSIKEKSEQISELTKGGAHYPCTECHRSFKLEKYLLLHMRLHTGEKRFKCNLCPQAYHRSGSLWKHKRTHHNVKVFSCPICQKRFGLKIQLTKHVETHQNSVDFSHTDTVFACSRCDKTFTTLLKYKQHERVHHV
ncbi:Protein suppressor of hairy wing [Gryllus bimaculatus]|nr:Protein suppressor of hairy wing [Gryllus bimaculatus]